MFKKIPTSVVAWDKGELCTVDELKNRLLALGIELDNKTGHLFYTSQFKPLEPHFELVFVRHGETYGNCGQSTASGELDHKLILTGKKDKDKRIFQGNVDGEINQLTEHGKEQAMSVAARLNNSFVKEGWIPDIILVSPLRRAQETSLPFVHQTSFQDRYVIHEGIREMSFGSWENQRVCDIDPSDSRHLFYREQNALVKCSLNVDRAEERAENFCEVLLRAHLVLKNLHEDFSRKKILMFSHSMFGAACCILLGKGQKIENNEYLAFDGVRQSGLSYAIPNATPVSLTTLTDSKGLSFTVKSFEEVAREEKQKSMCPIVTDPITQITPPFHHKKYR